MSLPCGRYAPMVRTSKWIWRARSGTAVKIVLIRIISTIVVSIAKPVRFYTNCRIFTLHMTLRAGYILISTSYFRLIRSTVVLAIVDTITFLTFRDTSIVFAGEFTGSTIFVFSGTLLRLFCHRSTDTAQHLHVRLRKTRQNVKKVSYQPSGKWTLIDGVHN